MKSIIFSFLIISTVFSCQRFDSRYKEYFKIEGEWNLKEVTYEVDGQTVIMDNINSNVTFTNCLDGDDPEERCLGLQIIEGKEYEFKYYVYKERFDVKTDLRIEGGEIPIFALGLSGVYDVLESSKHLFVFKTEGQINPGTNKPYSNLVFTLER